MLGFFNTTAEKKQRQQEHCK